MPRPKKPASDVDRWATEGGIDPVDHERTVRALKRRVQELEQVRKSLHERLDDAEDRLDVALAIADSPSPECSIEPRKRRQNEATAFLCASDWHVGELVDPSTVNGKNSYNPEIAQARGERYFQNSLRLIELARAGVRIDDVVLWLGGDMMTGYIHEELVESNTMSPSEECLFLLDMLSQGIEFLLDKGSIKRLVVPCNYGNHGRTNPKRRVSTGAKNSYEWMTYHVLAQRFASDKRVEFLVADSSHIYVDVYGHTVRLHHGDDVRYQGGVGGLSIPLRKATDSWDTFKEADLTVIGHWHQFVDYGYALVNGSLIGFNAYALSVKARFEPPRQAFFLIDKERGKTLVAPIWVE